MPVPYYSDATDSIAEVLYTTFGIPTPPPPPPLAPPTMGGAPTVSSTPVAGQGIALDSGGRLSVTVQFLGVLLSDPASPRTGQFWYRSDLSQLSICVDGTTVKRVTLT